MARNKRCTNNTLEAFGICKDDEVIHGTGVLSGLKDAGYTWTPMIFDETKTTRTGMKTPIAGMTLGAFRARFPTGNYYVMTNRHAMALIAGKLHDTAGGTNRRKVQGAFRVTGKLRKLRFKPRKR